MDSLFNKIIDFDNDVIRNIVSLRISEDLFDDLYPAGDEESKKIAITVEGRIKKSTPDMLSRGFLYTTSIEYPFKPENYHSTRYGDGSYPCWYGSLEEITTIYETSYHALMDVSGTEGISTIIERDRALYHIHCKAILIDLSDKHKEHQELMANDYGYTQSIGKRLYHEGHPGLLVPSARHLGGINTVIFNQHILNHPRQYCYLTYFIDPQKRTVRIEKKPGKTLATLVF